MRKMGLPLALGLLSACSGPGAPSLTVNLVDGLGEPLQPLAAAWRVGSGAWLALPTGQSSWVLPLPAGSGATFAVGFRCPSASPLSYVSLEAKRNEVGNTLILRCPLDWHSPTVAVSGSASPPMNGMVFSARGQATLNSGAFAGLTAPAGTGREVAALGSFGGTAYFGRSGLINLPSSPSLTLSSTLALTAVTPTGFPSRARVHLDTGVRVDLATWNGGNQTFPRPSPSALTPGELLEVHADFVTGLGILRLANQDPLAAPGGTVNLPVPLHTFTVVETHTATALPTFTFTPLGSVGFSPGLSPLGYALLLAEPGARYWRHFASPGVATGPTYTFNLEQAPGFSGVVPNGGSSVQLCASAFGGDQPLASLLASRPLPQETSACYTLFVDRHHPGRFEAAQHSLSFSW